MKQPTPLKALSFRQPWAELILQGQQSIILKPTATAHRGPLAIHVAQKIDKAACQQHQLPLTLPRGGVIGLVTLTHTQALSETTYHATQQQHLNHRPYQPKLHAWHLSNPRRLPALVPLPGRMTLFNVTLSLDPTLLLTADNPSAADLNPPTPSTAPKASLPDPNPAPPDRPFSLYLKNLPAPNGQAAYHLTLKHKFGQIPRQPAPIAPKHPSRVATLSGTPLQLIADYLLDALQQAGYRPTDLSPQRQTPFHLPEVVGVRLGLLFLALKPLSKLTRLETIAAAIHHMPVEEAYYWYSKCTTPPTADQAQIALRILLGGP